MVVSWPPYAWHSVRRESTFGVLFPYYGGTRSALASCMGSLRQAPCGGEQRLWSGELDTLVECLPIQEELVG